MRYDRLQQGLFEALQPVASSVVWAHSQVPREKLGGDILTLSISGGPNFRQQHARGDLLLPADSVVLRVTGDSAGKRTIAELNGFQYRHDVDGDDDIEAVRDSLLAAIQAGETGAVEATADGDDGISLEAEQVGGLRSLRLHGEITHEPPVFSDKAVLVTVGTVTHLVTLQAFSKSRTPRAGAIAILQHALSRLQRTSVAEELARYGVGIWNHGAAIPIPAVVGGSWETRCAADLTVASRSVDVEEIELIEDADLALTFGGLPE